MVSKKITQKQALIIANGESSSSALLKEVLHKNPFILVLDGARERIAKLGLKVDMVLGDFDGNVNSKKIMILDGFAHAQIIHAPDQNKTDLEKGIEQLISQSFRKITIIWATGRRADHTIANITNIVKYAKDAQIEIRDDYSKIFSLPQTFEKSYAKGTILSLIPVGKVEGITTNGLKFPLNNESLILGERIGSSNEAEKDGVVKIVHRSGDLLLMECHD